MIIKEAKYLLSAVKPDQYPNNNYPEFIFMGRSNVGKSSFINAITSRKNLAYTSSKPGKTLTLNFYEVNNQFYLIDVPGYGYAKQAFNMQMDFGKMMEKYLAASRNLKKAFLIIDSKVGPTEDDILMYNYLVYMHVEPVIVSTKYDKLNQSEKANCNKQILEKLKVNDSSNLYFVSSQSGYGIDKIQDLIESLL